MTKQKRAYKKRGPYKKKTNMPKADIELKYRADPIVVQRAIEASHNAMRLEAMKDGAIKIIPSDNESLNAKIDEALIRMRIDQRVDQHAKHLTYFTALAMSLFTILYGVSVYKF